MSGLKREIAVMERTGLPVPSAAEQP